MTLIDGSE